MSPEVIQAVIESDTRWEKIKEDPETLLQTGCPLCPLFQQDWDVCANSQDEVCPIAVKTGEVQCWNTPYCEVRDLVRAGFLVPLPKIDEMLDIIRSL